MGKDKRKFIIQKRLCDSGDSSSSCSCSDSSSVSCSSCSKKCSSESTNTFTCSETYDTSSCSSSSSSCSSSSQPKILIVEAKSSSSGSSCSSSSYYDCGGCGKCGKCKKKYRQHKIYNTGYGGCGGCGNCNNCNKGGHGYGNAYYNFCALPRPVKNLSTENDKSCGEIKITVSINCNTVTLQWNKFSGQVDASGQAYIYINQSFRGAPKNNIFFPYLVNFKGGDGLSVVEILPCNNTNTIRWYLTASRKGSNISNGDAFTIFEGAVTYIMANDCC